MIEINVYLHGNDADLLGAIKQLFSDVMDQKLLPIQNRLTQLEQQGDDRAKALLDGLQKHTADLSAALAGQTGPKT